MGADVLGDSCRQGEQIDPSMGRAAGRQRMNTARCGSPCGVAIGGKERSSAADRGVLAGNGRSRAASRQPDREALPHCCVGLGPWSEQRDQPNSERPRRLVSRTQAATATAAPARLDRSQVLNTRSDQLPSRPAGDVAIAICLPMPGHSSESLRLWPKTNMLLLHLPEDYKLLVLPLPLTGKRAKHR